MSSSKKIDLQRDFAADVYLSELRLRTLYPPPFHTVHTCIHYSYKEGGGGLERERRLEGQQFTKLGRKYQHD
jgi:hypothetical protein